MIKFTIYGQIRGGKNNMGITRTGLHYPKAAFRAWRDATLIQLATLGPIKLPDKPHRIMVKYWWGDRRRRDVPAMLDALYHCFERAGIISDDTYLDEVMWLPMHLDRKCPMAEIQIEER